MECPKCKKKMKVEDKCVVVTDGYIDETGTDFCSEISNIYCSWDCAKNGE